MPESAARVLYFNSVPSPYVVRRFNLLAQRQDFTFAAMFDLVDEPGRDWSVESSGWAFRSTTLQSTSDIKGAFVTVLKHKPTVYVGMYHSPLYLLTAVWAKILGASVIFRVLRTHETWNKRRLVRELLKHASFTLLADGFEVSGNDAAGFARKYTHGRNRKFFVTTQSVDVEALTEARKAKESDPTDSCAPITFLYVGRLLPEKGLYDLIDAFRIVQQAVGREKVRLRIAGSGPALDVALRRSASLQIEFLGYLQGYDLYAEYAGADIFVFPTHGDPYGLVLSEALVAGLPVITSSAAGELDVRVLNADTGIVVPPGDVGELAGAMKRLTSAPARKRMKYSSNALELGRSLTDENYVLDFATMVHSLSAGLNA